MSSFIDNKTTWALCAAVVVCGLLAAERLGRAMESRESTGRRASSPALATNETSWTRRVPLPSPAPRPGEPPAPQPASTPEEQAAAGTRVVAGSLVRALSQAAAEGNEQAVEDLVRGLPRYGEAAREAIQDELSRTKAPKSREALTRALAELRS